MFKRFPTGQRPHFVGVDHTKTLLNEANDQILLLFFL